MSVVRRSGAASSVSFFSILSISGRWSLIFCNPGSFTECPGQLCRGLHASIEPQEERLDLTELAEGRKKTGEEEIIRDFWDFAAHNERNYRKNDIFQSAERIAEEKTQLVFCGWSLSSQHLHCLDKREWQLPTHRHKIAFSVEESGASPSSPSPVS